MSPPSDKTIRVTHTGDGTVVFPVPLFSLATPERLILKMQRSKPLSSKQILKTPLWLKYLKMGGNLQNMLKKNGSFYVELLQEGFLRNGAITLIGLMPPLQTPSSGLPTESKKIFKAVIQLDGDIICQIDRAVLKEKHLTKLLEGFTAVQDQFFAGFNKVLRSIRLLIIAALSTCIPALYLIWKLLQ